MSSRDALALDAGNILPEGAVRTTRTSVNQPQSSTILTGNASRARMPDNWGQLSPVRNQGLIPSAVPAHSAATSTANTRQGINDIGTNDHGVSMSVISDEDLAKLLDELGQIWVSIDNYSNNID